MDRLPSLKAKQTKHTKDPLPPDVEAEVLKGIIYPDSFVMKLPRQYTTLIRCGYFFTACYQSFIDEADEVPMSVASIVLDYDMNRVDISQPKDASFIDRSRDRVRHIHMFRDRNSLRCELTARYLKVSNDPRIIDVAVHDLYPSLLSVLVESDHMLPQRDLMGGIMTHELAEGFTMSPVYDTMWYKGFTPWTFAESGDTTNLPVEDLRFNDSRKLNILVWFINVSRIIEQAEDDTT
ncbi:hypothetical protein ElyMa_004523400 [Elysia marginata]|uniref:Uncharacterized protein n=1 Tax=Elysia marginata TaxID=1093978 RepID=A0AAV4HPJ6_9GAST|nr:hypothetical protein ElyMa_004523400 [Elysia marginata]